MLTVWQIFVSMIMAVWAFYGLAITTVGTVGIISSDFFGALEAAEILHTATNL